jgi:hypothetical protein
MLTEQHGLLFLFFNTKITLEKGMLISAFISGFAAWLRYKKAWLLNNNQ